MVGQCGHVVGPVEHRSSRLGRRPADAGAVRGDHADTGGWAPCRPARHEPGVEDHRRGVTVADGPPGPRGAQPYRVTDDGRQAFAAWMAAFVARGPRDDQLRSPLLLAVFFGHFVDPATMRPLIEEYRARHQRGLALAESMLAAL